MGAPAKKTNADYSDLLAKLNDIPTLPVVAMKVNDLINNPNSSSAEIAAVLKKDQVARNQGRWTQQVIRKRIRQSSRAWVGHWNTG